jgi:hypothetical protein
MRGSRGVALFLLAIPWLAGAVPPLSSPATAASRASEEQALRQRLDRTTDPVQREDLEREIAELRERAPCPDAEAVAAAAPASAVPPPEQAIEAGGGGGGGGH